MILFKNWLLEFEEKGYNFYKNIILGKLNLDHDEGITQSLSLWQPDQLIGILNGLGEYKELSQETRDQVEGQIRSGMGTLGDVIRLMSSSGRQSQNL